MLFRSIDVDAVAGWLGSYGGEDSPDDISRGLFAGEVGSPRLLKMFGRMGIKTTWFIPGHSIETFPKEMKAVADAGHEIGIHGYSHENPIAMTREQETEILDKCIDLVARLSGKRPTGYVAPRWEFSPVTRSCRCIAWALSTSRASPMFSASVQNRRTRRQERLASLQRRHLRPHRQGVGEPQGHLRPSQDPRRRMRTH